MVQWRDSHTPIHSGKAIDLVASLGEWQQLHLNSNWRQTSEIEPLWWVGPMGLVI